MTARTDGELDTWIESLKPGSKVRISAQLPICGITRFAGCEAQVRSVNTLGLMLAIPGEPGEWFATIEDIDPPQEST